MTGIVTATGTLVRRIRLPQRLRNLELALLIGALILTGGALLLVQVGALSHLTSDVALLWVAPAALTVVLHCCLRAVARDADPFFLPVGTLLNGLGIAMIYRIDLANNASGWNSSAMRQVVWTGIAMVCAGATILAVRNHRVLQRYMYIAGFLAIALLLLPLLPGIGLEVNGARVWIGIGDLLTFQPGELVKIALAVFFAGFLVRTRDSLATVGRRFLGLPLPRARDVGPLVVVWLLCMAVIVFQRDLGTAVLYFGVFLVVLYVATGRSSWIILGLTLFTAGGALASQALPYVGARFANWLDPFNPARYDAVTGGSYQLAQGLFGLANGGLIGTGWGVGQPQITPLAQSDYIIASLGEELGLAGLFAILALYLLLTARGFRIGFAGLDDFGKLLGVGLTTVLTLQVFVVTGGVLRIIPLTGLVTPFLAAGGSALVANWVILAFLIRLSDTVRRQPRLIVEATG